MRIILLVAVGIALARELFRVSDQIRISKEIREAWRDKVIELLIKNGLEKEEARRQTKEALQ